DYLRDTLDQAARGSSSTLERIHGEVFSLRPAARGYELGLADGATLPADQVVLALGHSQPRVPHPAESLLACGAYVGNPWDLAALDRIDPGMPVALLGTGHTAVDALFRLTAGSDTRKVFMISRRGLLTHGHRFTPKPPVASADFSLYLQTLNPTARTFLRALRAEAARRMQAGGDWRDVINELRPQLPGLWARLPAAERGRFLAHVQPYWDIHRHRLAPAAHRRLAQMLQSGQVEVIAGRVFNCERRGGEVVLAVRQRARGAVKPLHVAAVVNCTGPDYDLNRATSPLLRQLRDDGMVRRDTHGLGIDVDGQYRPLGADGRPLPGLYYVGPMLKAQFWEAIAVPELRGHCARLAAFLGAPLAS
ncbi:MAG TPA: FAD/NAD(P)-binding protein, partial [Burkholderiales bacterium]|nr:FAD/NAD(P)-binding protein [Burkholderiales bacterium]